MYTPKSIMSSNTRFETWSFDKACMRMDENTLHTAGIVVAVDVGAVDNSDLIIFGIYGITKDVMCPSLFYLVKQKISTKHTEACFQT